MRRNADERCESLLKQVGEALKKDAMLTCIRTFVTTFGAWLTYDEVRCYCHIPEEKFARLVDGGVIKKMKFGETKNCRTVYSRADIDKVLDKFAAIEGRITNEVVDDIIKEAQK